MIRKVVIVAFLLTTGMVFTQGLTAEERKLSRAEFDLIRPVIHDVNGELDEIIRRVTDIQRKLRDIEAPHVHRDSDKEVVCDGEKCRVLPKRKAPTCARPAGEGWQWDGERETWWRWGTAPTAAITYGALPTSVYAAPSFSTVVPTYRACSSGYCGAPAMPSFGAYAGGSFMSSFGSCGGGGCSSGRCGR